jgi:hypothetical protein
MFPSTFVTQNSPAALKHLLDVQTKTQLLLASAVNDSIIPFHILAPV